MIDKMTIDALLPEESGTVLYIDECCNIKSRLNDMGIIKNTLIKCIGQSPMGDPKAYLIRGTVVSIRNCDAKNINIVKQETEKTKSEFTLLLAGNPNVGKSTVFNELTGLKQHTGNWIGKTVDSAKGFFETKKNKYTIIDLPGTHSLETLSPEEVYAKELILSDAYDKIIVILDATNLEHSLNLALQIRTLTDKALFCVNLLDEASRQDIEIDLDKLEFHLNAPTIGIVAWDKKSYYRLRNFIDDNISKVAAEPENISEEIFSEESRIKRIEKAESITAQCVKQTNKSQQFNTIDKILTSRRFGFPIMLCSLLLLFWLTIYGANYPSNLLSDLFGYIGFHLHNILIYLKLPTFIISLVIDGIYNMTSRVIAVMLPPMAIFFPLFTLLEDFGYLPRIAFNLDKPFAKCRACGKQALTMCMGFGCNACGVTGARIINSPRERLLAIVTNSLVPCNGKFPTVIAIITMFLILDNKNDFLGFGGSLLLASLIIVCVFVTLFATFILSHTFLKGETSSYLLELPPYRKPQFGKVILRSVIDRTAIVLSRAIKAAIPAGVIVWMVANIQIKDTSLLSHFTEFVHPFATLFGLDGVILTAFILGIAANETVIPIMIMSYLSLGSPIEMGNIQELHQLLINNGWTNITAICTIMFTLFHWPCATTLLTIKKETNSKKWVLLSATLPTLIGLIICFLISTLAKHF